MEHKIVIFREQRLFCNTYRLLNSQHWLLYFIKKIFYISISLFFLIFGKSNEGKSFFCINWTLCPFKVYSTTYTILSIWVTPTALISANSGIFCSPWGTQPATTNGFLIFLALQTILMKASWEGLTTVQLLIKIKSASSELSTILYPYYESCPIIN